MTDLFIFFFGIRLQSVCMIAKGKLMKFLCFLWLFVSGCWLIGVNNRRLFCKRFVRASIVVIVCERPNEKKRVRSRKHNRLAQVEEGRRKSVQIVTHIASHALGHNRRGEVQAGWHSATPPRADGCTNQQFYRPCTKERQALQSRSPITRER